METYDHRRESQPIRSLDLHLSCWSVPDPTNQLMDATISSVVLMYVPGVGFFPLLLRERVLILGTPAKASLEDS